MSNGNQSFDQILEEVFSGSGGVAAAAADVSGLAVPGFCKVWPLIREFLQWAKDQTKNPIAKLVIEGLIRLGDSRCKS